MLGERGERDPASEATEAAVSMDAIFDPDDDCVGGGKSGGSGEYGRTTREPVPMAKSSCITLTKFGVEKEG